MIALLWLLQALVAAHVAAGSAPSQELIFRYDPRYAAGVSGEVRISFKPTRRYPNKAVITANLDFTRVSSRVLKRLNCRDQVTEYEWHLHTKWTAAHPSGSLKDCSPRQAGDHYDPDYACGPSSEFGDTRICRSRRGRYRCTPSRYIEDSRVCERGDFSGKFGNFVLDENQRVRGRWVDPAFASFADVSKEWNVIVHPVCDSPGTPRLACALVQKSRLSS